MVGNILFNKKNLNSVIMLLLIVPLIEAENLQIYLDNQTRFFTGDEGILKFIINNSDTETHSGLITITIFLSDNNSIAGFIENSKFIPIDINITGLNISNVEHKDFVNLKPGVSVYNLSIGTTDNFVYVNVNISVSFNDYFLKTNEVPIEFSENQLDATSDTINNYSHSLTSYYSNKVDYSNIRTIVSVEEELLPVDSIIQKIESENKINQKPLNKSDTEGKLSNQNDDSITNRKQFSFQILYNNTKFLEFNESLTKDKYKLSTISYNKVINFSFINLTYTKGYHNVVLESKINFTEVVYIKKHEKSQLLSNLVKILPFLFLALVVLISFTFWKKKEENAEEDTFKENSQPINYMEQIRKMINKAEKIYKEKLHESYWLLDEAFRMFLSYEEGKNKHMTKEEILKELNKFKEKITEIKKILDECEDVIYLGKEDNEKDFEEKLKQIKNFVYSN